MKAVVPHTFADSCIIFISFMNFMVKLAVLSGFVPLCETWFCNGGDYLTQRRKDAKSGIRENLFTTEVTEDTEVKT